MSDHHDPLSDTRPNRRLDLEQTIPGQAFRRLPAATITAAVPTSAAAPSVPARAPRRRSRPGLGGCALKAGMIASAFAVAAAAFLAGLYVLFPPARTTYLILGLDARTGEGSVTRSDTMVLITIDPKQPYVGMLSLPRDLYVDVPGYGMQRINAANVLGELEAPGGGMTLAERTVEGTFGLQVTRVVRLNFGGFIEIVDAAGGVTIDVPEYFVDYEYPTADYGTMVVEFQPGRQHMSGEQALQYARIRHGSSDFARATRQQQVITGLADQMLWPGNWFRAPQVVSAILRNTESNLTPIDLVLAAPTLLWVQATSGIDQRVLNSDYVEGVTTAGGASVLAPRWDQVNPLIEDMFLR